jgi:hypothetical protein
MTGYAKKTMNPTIHGAAKARPVSCALRDARRL